MRENVGGMNQMVRAVAGPALMALGYTRLGGRNGELGGIPLQRLGVSSGGSVASLRRIVATLWRLGEPYGGSP